MKKGIGKNQMIIAMLAVMIVIAGYLNFRSGGAGLKDVFQVFKKEMSETEAVIYELSENEVREIEVPQEEPEDTEVHESSEVPENVGEAVLTSAVHAQNFSAQARMEREQMRSKNKEALLEVIDHAGVTDTLKQSAMEDLIAMTNRSEMEMAAENLLNAKGFENSVVCLTKDSCDVIVCRKALEESERAQIEDIVRRKTDIDVENIVITTLNE